MYIYNTIYNYYIRYFIHPLLLKADSNKFQSALCHTLPPFYTTGKEDENSRHSPLYFAVTLVTRHAFTPKSTPQSPPLCLTTLRQTPRVHAALASR